MYKLLIVDECSGDSLIEEDGSKYYIIALNYHFRFSLPEEGADILFYQNENKNLVHSELEFETFEELTYSLKQIKDKNHNFIKLVGLDNDLLITEMHNKYYIVDPMFPDYGFRDPVYIDNYKHITPVLVKNLKQASAYVYNHFWDINLLKQRIYEKLKNRDILTAEKLIKQFKSEFNIEFKINYSNYTYDSVKFHPDVYALTPDETVILTIPAGITITNVYENIFDIYENKSNCIASHEFNHKETLNIYCKEYNLYSFTISVVSGKPPEKNISKESNYTLLIIYNDGKNGMFKTIGDNYFMVNINTLDKIPLTKHDSMAMFEQCNISERVNLQFDLYTNLINKIRERSHN